MRRDERHPVRLQVRYQRAHEFIAEYADNLSAGGLFIVGATDLEPLQEVVVEIQLPGSATYQVVAQVAHVLDDAVAARLGRRAGVGLALVQSPPGFADALAAYLIRLGRRADHRVLCGHDGIRTLLGEAGYQTALTPPADQLLHVIAESAVPVLAVVVGSAAAEAYRAVAAAAGDPDLVKVLDRAPDLDRLLVELDDAL